MLKLMLTVLNEADRVQWQALSPLERLYMAPLCRSTMLGQ
jgi:hypothetical protein